MTGQAGREPREELTEIEGEIAELQRSAADLRQQVGGRTDGSVEPEEVAATIASAEEIEAIVDTLQSRREELLRKASTRQPSP